MRYFKTASLLLLSSVLSCALFAKNTITAPTAITVSMSPVSIQTVPIYIEALGNLTSEKSVTISSETDGRIQQIYFSNGQTVGKNIPILQQNNEVAQANYNSAVTTLNQSRQLLARDQSLPVGIIAQTTIDSQKATVATDKATVQQNQATLNQKTVTAPFGGIIGGINYQVGDYIKAGVPIATLVNSSEMVVSFSVNQKMAADLKSGQTIKFTVDSYPNKTFYATVNYISPTVETSTRTINIQGLNSNTKNLLSPGMFVHVKQQIGERKNAIVVPETALSADIKGYYVYRAINNHAVQTYVTTGTMLHGAIEIISGLTKNDKIITAGIQKLEDGSPITIQKTKKSPAAKSK